MRLTKIAMRSIVRNPRRMLVTSGAMAFAGAIMIFYSSLYEGFILAMERNALEMEKGDVQIHKAGFRRDPDLYKRIDDPDAIVSALTEKKYHAAPRLYGYGLAAAGHSSAGVELRGIDVEKEAQVTRIHEHLLQGDWLTSNDPKGVVLGRRLAKTLRVSLRSEVVVVSQAADGSMANDLYQVRGILKSVGELVDRGGLFMVAESFRELMTVPEGAHEIVVVRPNRRVPLEEATSVVSAVAANYEVNNWRQLHPALARLIDTSTALQMFMLIIIYFAIAMVVLNATLMSVFERIREFGIMKALGTLPRHVAAVIFLEVLFQGLLASAAALLLGVPVSLYFQANGIDLSGAMSDTHMLGISFEPVWYCDVSPSTVFMPVIVLLILILVAAIYPGLKAALIRPVRAIYHR